jgi:nitric oxide reductase large subunit
VWGHGSYVAPDWSADWLHRESLALLEIWAQKENKLSFEQLSTPRQGELKARLKEEMRGNTYDQKNGVITLSLNVQLQCNWSRNITSLCLVTIHLWKNCANSMR